jgi:hypothetical protein
MTQNEEANEDTSAELTVPSQAATTAEAKEGTISGLAQKQVVSVT